MCKDVKRKNGFTLVEMLIMLAVVGVVAGTLFGVVGNTYSTSTVKANAVRIADGARQIADGMQNYQAKFGTNADLSTVVSQGIINLPMVPSEIASSWALDSANYGTRTMLTLSVPTTQIAVCQKVNAMFAKLDDSADVPAAIDSTKDLQCYGSGPYTLVKFVYAK